jgi:hypothetical protein
MMRPDTKDAVRVIRDTRDSGRDYWIPRKKAEVLFTTGKLVMVNAHGDKLDYCEK